MERQLANLTGLVQKALTHAPHTSPSPRDYLQVPAGRDPYARGTGTLSVRFLKFSIHTNCNMCVIFWSLDAPHPVSLLSAKETFVPWFRVDFSFHRSNSSHHHLLLANLFSQSLAFTPSDSPRWEQFVSSKRTDSHFFSIRFFVALRHIRSISSLRSTDLFCDALPPVPFSLRECSSVP